MSLSLFLWTRSGGPGSRQNTARQHVLGDTVTGKEEAVTKEKQLECHTTTQHVPGNPVTM